MWKAAHDLPDRQMLDYKFVRTTPASQRHCAGADGIRVGAGMRFRALVLGGLAFTALSSVSTGAMAQCAATGAAVPLAAALSPFASGGAVNTLVSSINAASTA